MLKILHEFRDIKVCEKIFVACCCLHNFLLGQIETGLARVGQGRPIGDNGVCLDGHTTQPGMQSELGLSNQFGKRHLCSQLHLHS